jgi:preprotein translocase subunit YajC
MMPLIDTEVLNTLLAMAPPPTAPGAPQPNPLVSFFPFIIIIVMFYFLLIRPQQKRAKEHKALIDNLKSGDKILTSGGIYGVVTNVKDKVVTVRIADNVKIELDKASVASVTKDTDAPAS